MRLKELRKQKGLTQEEVTELLRLNFKIEISRPSIANYERGVLPSVDVLIGLADLYGVSVDFILNHEISGDTVVVTRCDQCKHSQKLVLKNGGIYMRCCKYLNLTSGFTHDVTPSDFCSEGEVEDG
ncbi:MAG: helix-turn-helix transcriptional regulator [Oscillospiraceae bacterium]|nr:helix-turn-helix transcriptional regulator [Oscillospiraceae bacterium]